MDPGLKRGYQMVWNVGVSHEVVGGLGVSASYHQRNYYRLNLLRNLAIPPEQYTLLSVADPRGNGETLPVYSINRGVFGLVDELAGPAGHVAASTEYSARRSGVRGCAGAADAIMWRAPATDATLAAARRAFLGRSRLRRAHVSAGRPP